jgi:hypothetical protein
MLCQLKAYIMVTVGKGEQIKITLTQYQIDTLDIPEAYLIEHNGKIFPVLKFVNKSGLINLDGKGFNFWVDPQYYTPLNF